jgi:hypothetical protein
MVNAPGQTAANQAGDESYLQAAKKIPESKMRKLTVRL